MQLATIASELLEIEDQATDRAPPADKDQRWTELTVQLINRLREFANERRRWVRLAIPDAEVTLQAGGHQATGNTRTGNLSNTGITVWVARDALDLGADRVRLSGVRFRGQYYPQDLRCEAVWSHDWGDARHVGLRFEAMTGQQRSQFYPCYYRAYREFLAQLAG